MNEFREMTPVEEQAALWLFRSDLGLSPQDEAELGAWLSASDENLLAWERGLGAINRIDRDDPLIEAMRTDALTARPAVTVHFRRALVGVAAVLVLGVIGLTSWRALAPSTLAPGSHSTLTAMNDLPRIVSGDAPRSVSLPDGSLATLDRQTALAMNYGATRRELRILRGRAVFDVKHDGRTFAVEAGDVTVTDVGTKFAVQLRADGVIASLGRGRIAVTRKGDPATVKLVPGQSVTAITGQPFSLSMADPTTMFGWSAIFIEFQDTPLEQAVAELNKHNATPLRVVGAAGHLPITGRFRTDDTEGFVSAVTQILPVKRRVGRDGVIELVHR